MALVLNGSNDTITGLQINSANIVNGSIVNDDINASAAIAGTKISGGVGKILQVVQHEFTTGQFVTTSSSFVDVTGFSQAITPTAASSKILVMLSCHLSTNPSGTYNGQCSLSINRSIAGGSYTGIAAHSNGSYIQETYAMYHDNSVSINLLDSPSYTLGNAITYKLQVRSYDTSVTTRINIAHANLATSKLLLIEVAA